MDSWYSSAEICYLKIFFKLGKISYMQFQFCRQTDKQILDRHLEMLIMDRGDVLRSKCCWGWMNGNDLLKKPQLKRNMWTITLQRTRKSRAMPFKYKMQTQFLSKCMTLSIASQRELRKPIKCSKWLGSSPVQDTSRDVKSCSILTDIMWLSIAALSMTQYINSQYTSPPDQ